MHNKRCTIETDTGQTLQIKVVKFCSGVTGNKLCNNTTSCFSVFHLYNELKNERKEGDEVKFRKVTKGHW